MLSSRAEMTGSSWVKRLIGDNKSNDSFNPFVPQGKVENQRIHFTALTTTEY